jgi:hypothetical protein
MAWVTMWKIGPECATQHAKCVSAINQNCGERQISGSGTLRSVTPPVATGAFLIRSARGMITIQTTSPSTSMATRQSYPLMSQRVKGAMTKVPTPVPADTRATARPRRAVNQCVVVVVSGA